MTSMFSDHLRYNLVRQESLKINYNSILTKASATQKRLAEKWFTTAMRALELQAVDQEILIDDPTRDIDCWEVDDTEEKLLEALEEFGEALLRSSDKELYQHLVKSVEANDLIMIRLLLEDGRAALNDSKILLMAKSGEAIRLLLEDGRVDPTADAYQCLYEAIIKNRPEVLKELLRDERIDVRAAETTRSLIDQAMCSNCSIEILRILVNDERVDVNSPHISRWPHLYAILEGKSEMLRLFLDCERYVFNQADTFVNERNLTFLRVENHNKECDDIFRKHPRVIAAFAPSHPELFSN